MCCYYFVLLFYHKFKISFAIILCTWKNILWLFQNVCVDDEFMWEGVVYNLDYRPIDGDVSREQNALATVNFRPHGNCVLLLATFHYLRVHTWWIRIYKFIFVEIKYWYNCHPSLHPSYCQIVHKLIKLKCLQSCSFF